ncbi:MAG: HAD family hydrolase [Deltaproteobacteria bacterium]|nr:HAD family hydrolase [Deltaproteobacteria bacterium]
MSGRPALFLDRDGVLIEDIHLMTEVSAVRILPGVPEAVARAQALGLPVIGVSNQSVVARGMCTEEQVAAVNRHIEAEMIAAGCQPILAFYFCPHHPEATVAAYRQVCDCRKPNPGMLLRAASEHGIDLGASFMVGDRPTDVLAGYRAGCTTIAVDTGVQDVPLLSGVSADELVDADYECSDLGAAVDFIAVRLQGRG